MGPVFRVCDIGWWANEEKNYKRNEERIEGVIMQEDEHLLVITGH